MEPKQKQYPVVDVTGDRSKVRCCKEQYCIGTTRPFRYDLNQIPYDYTVQVRNRFKGLDLIDRVPDELWTEVRDRLKRTFYGRSLEIGPGCSLEGMMLKLKLQYFGHLM